MNKKNYPLLVALVCALFCFTVTQAQDKLWGSGYYDGNFIFSVNGDGTDYQRFDEFGSTALGEHLLRLQKLPTGEMLVITRSGGKHNQGTICKITAGGVVKLYDIDDWRGGSDIASTMAIGKDGYGYAIVFNFATPNMPYNLIRFKLDGSSYEQKRLYNNEANRAAALAGATQGVYGVGSGGALPKNGVIYKVRPDLSGIDIIHRFVDAVNGRRPLAPVMEGQDGYLYGTTQQGGIYGYGTIFKIRQDGSDFIKLHDFDLANGSGPIKQLEQDAGGVLYGSTDKGGKRALGVSFKINADGTNFQKIRDLADPDPNPQRLDDTGVFRPIPAFPSAGVQYSVWGSASFVPDVNIDNPANGSSGLPVNLVVQSKRFSGATKYDVALSESPDFNGDVQHFSSERPGVNVTGLKHGTTYYARVKPNVWSYYGKITSFTTAEPADSLERLWGMNHFSMISMNKDGSDFHTTVFTGKYSFDNFIKLKNGDILMVGDSSTYPPGTVYIDGVIAKITPSGIDKLYEIQEYTLSNDIARSMAEGNDGYIYALRYDFSTSSFWGIVRFKLDGSGIESYRVNQRDFLFTSPLANTTEGVYGVSRGSATNNGFIFRIKPDARGIDIVYNFTDKQPMGRLIQGRDGYLYGVTKLGGNFGVGTIYKVRPDGSDYQKLFDFDYINGRNPERGLVQDAAGTLYGVAPRGGNGGVGTLFSINENGSGFSKLLDFSSIGGKHPNTEVVVDHNGNIYGSVSGIGVYKIRTDGTGFQALKSLANNDITTSLTLSKQILAPSVQVIQPEHQAVDVSVHPEVQFKFFPWTTQYTLELSEHADFRGNVLQWQSHEPNMVLDDLKYNTVYYTRVKSDLLPYYGPVTWFTTGSSVENIFIVSPAEGDTDVATDGLEVNVNHIHGAVQYTVQLTDNAFDLPLGDFYLEETSEQPILVFNGLEPGGLYYGRAKTDLSPDWGPIRTFTTAGEWGTWNTFTTDVYPNPSSHTFVYNRASSGSAITVTDINGAVVYQKEIVADAKPLEFGSNLGKGVYILKIQEKYGVKVMRLLKN